MINVFANYYEENNPIRKEEIYRCINTNYNFKYINYILINSNDRLKFNYLFNIINEYTGNQDINIIANLDIYFDDTILKTKEIKQDQFLCLSRWEVNGANIRFCNWAYSQDAWVFRGKSKNINGDFFLGWRGCDNRIAYEAKNAGYEVSNPSLDIKVYHIHNSNVRDYNWSQDEKKVVPPPHLTVEPGHF